MSKRPSAAATLAGRLDGSASAAAANASAGRHRAADPLQRDPVDELLLDAAGARVALEPCELFFGVSPSSPAGACSGATNGGRPGANWGWRMSSARSAAGESGSRRSASSPLPAARRIAVAAREQREPEVEADDAAVRLGGGELLQALDGPVRPGRDRRPDGGLDGVGVLGQQLVEARAGRFSVAVVEERLGVAQRPRFEVVADGEAELERRRRRSADVVAGAALSSSAWSTVTPTTTAAAAVAARPTRRRARPWDTRRA